jgi:hypothetical protein
MMRHLSPIVFTLVFGAWSQVSQAAIINFEDIPTAPGTNNIEGSETSDGFLFTSPSSHIHRVNQAGSFGDSGSTNLMIHDNGGGNAGNALTMAAVSGGAFNINSALLSEGFVGFGAATVHVVGNIFGGGAVTTDFALDGIIDGVGGVNDFQTFNFSGAWTNLTSVTFSGVGGTVNEHAFSIDNIVVNQAQAIPEASSLALLGLALAGLGFSRRKKA